MLDNGRYTYRNLKEALNSLTDEQLDSQVVMWDGLNGEFPQTLLVPTENWYQKEDGTFAPASKFDEPEDEIGDVVFYANHPVLIDTINDEFDLN